MATALCDHALKLAPKDLGVLVAAAQAADLSGDGVRARGYLQLACACHPSSAMAAAALGALLDKHGCGASDVEACYIRAIDLQPDDGACVAAAAAAAAVTGAVVVCCFY